MKDLELSDRKCKRKGCKNKAVYTRRLCRKHIKEKGVVAHLKYLSTKTYK